MRHMLLLVVAAGCTHHRDIKDARSLAGSEVDVTGPYGQTVTAVGTETPTGIVFVDKVSGGVVPTAEIRQISTTDHAQGAIEGLALGGGIGIVTGAIIGASSGDDECDQDAAGGCILTFSAGDKAKILALLLGLAGGTIGLVVGGAQGATLIYEHPTTPVTVRAVGPSGSVAGVTIDF